MCRHARSERGGLITPPGADASAELGAVVWLTGVPAAGKTTIARLLAERVRMGRLPSVVLDGDELREGLCRDLGFSEGDRRENVRRVAEFARILVHSGFACVCALVSPYREARRLARELVPPGRFLEVHVTCPLAICRQRDPKGLYRRLRAGEIAGVTGVDAPYEAPPDPELLVRSDREAAADAAGRIADLLFARVGVPSRRDAP